ncbi:hypothetical protein AGMMS49983_15860 [Clostridia bacterium]|nr:hypothetical protein AGMMS49983_15860 [Clostridia bacterium]
MQPYVTINTMANVKLSFPEYGITSEAGKGTNLLDVIRMNELPIEAPCGGRGTCGKCKVRVNGLELQACKTTVEEDAEIYILSAAADQNILTESAASRDGGDREPDSGRLAFAIDIGTTTVVVKAIDTSSGRELGIRAFTNPQRPYGADVLSRINISMDDASLLSDIITEALDQAIAGILQDAKISKENVEKVVIAGNTTMSYILLNLRCRSLGLAPFAAEYEIEPSYPYQRIFEQDTLACPVLVYPFISSFVGGDIVAGLVHIGTHWEVLETSSFLLVDMGTNGEIAYRHLGRMITTSTAAGPALEGGNITCGMSGTEGAIYAADYMEDTGTFVFKTIGQSPARGICGSGVIDLVAKLLAAGLIEPTGAFSDKGLAAAIDYVPDAPDARTMKAFLISEETKDSPRIVFTQKDVREFQLAKGAIRAGIDILISEMGELPQTFYLAGGFGQNIDLESAFAVGLIPDTLRGRIRFAGNTSLGGCIDTCLRKAGMGVFDDAEEINLGAHKDFNNIFMDTMMF